MQKKVFAIIVVSLLMLVTVGAVYLLQLTQATPLDLEIMCGGTVDKKPSDSFTVKIAFKNKGTTQGTWKISVTFESDDWNWKGEKKTLTMKPGEKRTLKWEDLVPEDAAIDSIARLVVYYDSEFAALNWWIRVIGDAELCITYSNVS